MAVELSARATGERRGRWANRAGTVVLHGRQPEPEPAVTDEVGRDERLERHRLADEVALGVVDARNGRNREARHTAAMEFTTELLSTGGTTTGFVVPDAVVEALGAGRRPKVVVTVAGYTWRTSIASMGGRFLLGASAAVRAAAGLTAGESYAVGVEVDTAVRTVEVPEDLAAALAAEPGAAAAWAGLTYSQQRQHAEALLAAKKPETRERRVAGIVDALR
jgi:hypothetical protein